MCVLSGPTHVIELMNDAYQQLIGHRRVEGMPLRDALPELTGQGFFELLDTVLRPRHALRRQARRIMLQRESGAPLAERFLDFVYQPILDANGAATGVFAEGSDVTERVLAENALRALNSSLEDTHRRTHPRGGGSAGAPAHRIRASARPRRRRCARPRRWRPSASSPAGSAHDFNNLLAGITGSLELMQRRAQAGPPRRPGALHQRRPGRGAARRRPDAPAAGLLAPPDAGPQGDRTSTGWCAAWKT